MRFDTGRTAMIVCCVFFLCGAVGLAAEEPTLQQRLDRLAERLEEQRIASNIPGMAIAVIKDDRVVLSRGFGMADLENETPVTPETLFAIGSTTKAFTATAVGMLVDEGKMSWDDPVTRHLPYFELAIDTEEADAEVTIRDLLCHRTGFSRMGILWASGRTSSKQVLRTATRAEPTAPFRERFIYCNVTYMGAGVAAGAAAGSDWDALITRRVFEPLGMTDSNLSYADAQADPRLSNGYTWDESLEEFRRVPMRRIDAIGPAGSINSNVTDMARWVRFLLAGGVVNGERLISKEQLDTTMTKQIDAAGDVGYGLGWMLHDIQGHRAVEHGGSIDGYAAQVGLFPDDGLGFVLLTNVTMTPLQGLSNVLVVETLLAEWDDPAAAEAGAESFEPYLGKYEANFATFKDARFTVLVQNDRLAVDVPGQMVFELKPPDEEGKWVFAITDQISVSFERDESGAVTTMYMYQAGMKFELPREGLERKPEIDLDAVAHYLGIYEMEGMRVTVLTHKQRLAVDVPGQSLFELHPPDEEGKWVFRMTDRMAVSFNLTEDGTIESMTFHEGGESRELTRVDVGEPGEGGAPDFPSVEELTALRDVEGRGLTPDRLGALRITGSVRMVSSGIEGKFTLRTSGAERLRTELDLGKFGHETLILSDGRGWSESDLQPSRELTGVHLAEARLEFALAGDWVEDFHTVKVTGKENLDGRDAWVVRLEAEEVLPIIAYVDAETGDLLQTEIRVHPPLHTAMTVRNVTRLSDYRTVDGMRFPWRSESSNEFTGRIVTQILKLESDARAKDDLFEIPDAAE